MPWKVLRKGPDVGRWERTARGPGGLWSVLMAILADMYRVHTMLLGPRTPGELERAGQGASGSGS